MAVSEAFSFHGKQNNETSLARYKQTRLPQQRSEVTRRLIAVVTRLLPLIKSVQNIAK